jgi:hypothetical protein
MNVSDYTPAAQTLGKPHDTVLQRRAVALEIASFPGSRFSTTIVLVKQRIIDYHQDEEGHWVADLACGHTQHLRHNPPWTSRPWVTTKEGRDRHLGTELNCKDCDKDQASAG